MSARAANEEPQDRRVRRTRAAIIAAFNRLVLERGYASLTPGEVAAAADVGRSTVYEHFRGLDDLLGHSLRPLLAPLARGLSEASVPASAIKALEHLWENRRLARTLLTGDTYGIVLRSFAAEFAGALAGLGVTAGAGEPALGRDLIALQLAAGQLAVLAAWLSGRAREGPAQIACGLHASGRASVLALLRGPRTAD